MLSSSYSHELIDAKKHRDGNYTNYIVTMNQLNSEINIHEQLVTSFDSEPEDLKEYYYRLAY